MLLSYDKHNYKENHVSRDVSFSKILAFSGTTFFLFMYFFLFNIRIERHLRTNAASHFKEGNVFVLLELKLKGSTVSETIK